MKISRAILAFIAALILLTGCGSNAPELASAPGSFTPPTEVPETVAGPTSTNEVVASPLAVPTVGEEPVQTEEQTILSSFSQPVTAGGEPLVLYGHVLDPNSTPLSGYAVEIWQVDANGIYDHPGDRNTANRDMGFQFYGTALTDENGLFAFRTIVPARYEPRPRHIHFKVRKDGAEVLTSQFYFADEVDAAQLGSDGEMLLLDLRDSQDGGGNNVKLAFVNIVMDIGLGGSLVVTPSQTEGPYYPLADVSAFDNDLVSVN